MKKIFHILRVYFLVEATMRTTNKEMKNEYWMNYPQIYIDTKAIEDIYYLFYPKNK